MYQGSLRFLLAMIVVYAHYFPNIGHVGKFAVMGFFVVSGYLITRVVGGPYSNGFDGLKRFAANRILRIYPTYWVCALISLIVIIIYPTQAFNIKPSMQIPHSGWEWFLQVVIFGLLDPESGRNEVMLVPVAWSLSVELFFYVVIALFASRSKYVTLAWFGLSGFIATYHVFYSSIDRAYFSYDGTMIAFAAGATLYFYEKPLILFLQNLYGNRKVTAFIISCAAICTLSLWQEPIAIVAYLNGADIDDLRSSIPYDHLFLIYLTIPIVAISLLLSMEIKADEKKGFFYSRFLAKVNELLADLSYPIFLLHWAVLVQVTAAFGGRGGEGLDRNPLYSVIAVPIVIVIAYLVVRFVERPVGVLRKMIRPVPHVSSPPP